MEHVTGQRLHHNVVERRCVRVITGEDLRAERKKLQKEKSSESKESLRIQELILK
jgi:hypothetical protein